MNTVDHLKKIRLKFEAGNSPELMDLKVTPSDFEFIFGIAAEGMTPFEYKLLNKSEGDNISLTITKETYGPLFEHLHPPVWDLLNGLNSLYLKVAIVSVLPAENREILKAMSEMVAHGSSGCGCDGSCGCGCG